MELVHWIIFSKSEHSAGTKHGKSCDFNNVPTLNLNDLTFKFHAKQKELFSLHSKQSTSEIYTISL